MGSCFSKPKDVPVVKEKTTTGKSRLKSTGHRLGDNGEQTTNQPPSSGGGHPKTDSREAAARAAEERYNNRQNELKSSQDKLKSMAKLSKSEKGL